MDFQGKDWISEECSSDNPDSHSRDSSTALKTVKESVDNSSIYTIKTLEEENRQLRQRLSIAQARLEILKNEKELHIQSHTNDRAVWDFEKYSLLSDLKKVRTECKAEYEHALRLVNEVKDVVASFHFRITNKDLESAITPKYIEEKQKLSPRVNLESRFFNSRHSQKSSQSQKTVKPSRLKTTHKSRLVTEAKFSKLERLLDELEKKQRRLRSCVHAIEADTSQTKTYR